MRVSRFVGGWCRYSGVELGGVVGGGVEGGGGGGGGGGWGEGWRSLPWSLLLADAKGCVCMLVCVCDN